MFTYVTLGPWLVAPAVDTATDFWIINHDTGASLLTSDVFGAPFPEPREAVSPTWENVPFEINGWLEVPES